MASCIATANSDVIQALVPPTGASPLWICIEPVDIPQARQDQDQDPDQEQRPACVIGEVRAMTVKNRRGLNRRRRTGLSRSRRQAHDTPPATAASRGPDCVRTVVGPLPIGRRPP